jgi:outer membrane protein TolC
MKPKFSLLLLLLAFICRPAGAQVPAELQQLIQQSFTYFPQIKEAENGVTIANARLGLAQTKLPTVDFNGTYRFQQPRIEFPFGNEKLLAVPVNSIDVNLQAQYALLDFGRVKASVLKAKEEIAVAKGSIVQAKNQLATQVANLYYGVIYLRGAIAVQDSVVEFYQQSANLIQRRLNNGDAIRLDLLNVQSNLDAERNRRTDLQSQLDKQLNLLYYTTGDSTVTATDFPLASELPNLEQIGTEVADSNIEVQLAQLRLRSVEADRAGIRAANRPQVLVNTFAGPRNGFLPVVNELKFAYGAGASIRVPIFDGARTRRNLAITDATINQSQLALQSTQWQLQKDLQQNAIELRSNAVQLRNTAGQTESALAAQQITASRLLNGVATTLDLQNAATNVQRADLNRLQYEYKLWLAATERQRLTGQLVR